MNGPAQLEKDLLTVLEGRLRSAFQSVPDLSPSIRDRRERYSDVLLALCDFVHKSFSDSDPVSDEIFLLAEALRDLNHGIPSKLMSVSTSGRPAASSSMWRTRALICIAIEALVRFGMPKAKAIRYVSDTYPQLHELASKKARDFESAAHYWALQFANGRAKNDGAQDAYDEALVTIATTSKDKQLQTLKEWADYYLHHATLEARPET